MASEIGKKKKDAYPSKKTLNLYFKDDKTSKPSTINTYIIACSFRYISLLMNC